MSENGSRTLLDRAEHYIYLGAGYILVAAAAGLLAAAVIETVQTIREGHFAEGIVHLLDRVLLALMLAEIIYTLGRIAKTLKLEVTPFLIVGIIAAVRRMLVITAESSSHVDLQDPHFQAVLAELTLLAFMIFLLAWAIRLLAGRGEEPDLNQE